MTGKVKCFLMALLALLVLPSLAQEGWKNEKGQPTSDTESRRSVNGFGGWLLVTPDADWQAKWQTPSSTVPRFKEATSVAIGKQVFILTFLANPLLNTSGEADVSCDIDVVRPNGTTQLHQVDAPCFKGAIHEPPQHLFLSMAVLAFTGDPDDPLGPWVVKVTLKDNVRHAAVPLRTSFVLTR
jgi:hypothetical protein